MTRKDRKERQKESQHVDFIGKSFNLSDLSDLSCPSGFGIKRDLLRNVAAPERQQAGYLSLRSLRRANKAVLGRSVAGVFMMKYFCQKGFYAALFLAEPGRIPLT
jgi:hypothetical protein